MHIITLSTTYNIVFSKAPKIPLSLKFLNKILGIFEDSNVKRYVKYLYLELLKRYQLKKY